MSMYGLAEDLIKGLSESNKKFERAMFRLNQHKEKINQASLLMDEISCFDAIRLLVSSAYGKEIDSWNESRLIKEYSEALIALHSEAKNEKRPIELTIGVYKTISNHKFIEEVDLIDFENFSSVAEWDGLANKLSKYSIQARYIRKIVNRFNFKHIQNSDMPSKQRIEQGRNLIKKLYKELLPEELELATLATQGKKGLKSLIKSKISRKDYLELFPGQYDFKNRWDEVAKELRK